VITGYFHQGNNRMPIQYWVINRAMGTAKSFMCRFVSNDNKQYVTSKCTINFQNNYSIKDTFILKDIVPTFKAHFGDFIIISNFGNDGVTFRKIKPEDDVLETDLLNF
jgi:hypothetical protein